MTGSINFTHLNVEKQKILNTNQNNELALKTKHFLSCKEFFLEDQEVKDRL